jgi:hypothetical protein
MIQWRTLQPDELYRLDLIQAPSGLRYVRIRRADDKPTEGTALTTRPYKGSILTSFHANPCVSSEIVVEDGRSFGLNAHDVWMVEEEVEYWRSHRTHEGLASPDAPWVNGIPPIFAPS